MSRRVLLVFAFAVVSSGCIPVTEPVDDSEKAEVDESLLGTWEVDLNLKGKKTDRVKKSIEITKAPAIEGNPKGFMLWTVLGDGKKDTTWCYLSTVGKAKYVNVCLKRGVKTTDSPQFDKEGEYQQWAKGTDRRYLIFNYVTAESESLIRMGDSSAFRKLMENEKIGSLGVGIEAFYEAPPGWLRKYLEKNGPEPLFAKSEVVLKKKK